MRKSQYFPFQCWVLNNGTTGSIFITSLVWRGPWLGIEPGTSRTRCQHSTTRLPRRRYETAMKPDHYRTCVHVCQLLLTLCSWRPLRLSRSRTKNNSIKQVNWAWYCVSFLCLHPHVQFRWHTSTWARRLVYLVRKIQNYRRARSLTSNKLVSHVEKSLLSYLLAWVHVTQYMYIQLSLSQ